MKPENWIALGSAVLTGALTALGLYLAPKLAVKRALEQFRHEKLWERQEQLYSQLLTALSVIRSGLYNTYDHFLGKSVPDISEDDRKQSKEARRLIEELASNYLISSVTGNALIEFIKVLDSDSPDGFEGVDNAIVAIQKCINIVNQEARREIVTFASTSSTE